MFQSPSPPMHRGCCHEDSRSPGMDVHNETIIVLLFLISSLKYMGMALAVPKDGL